MLKTVTILVAALGCLSAGAASAQTVIYTDGPVYYGYADGPAPYAYRSGYDVYNFGERPASRKDEISGPRVYGYVRRVDPDDRYVEVYRNGGCGTYRYWDGSGCVDARDR